MKGLNIGSTWSCENDEPVGEGQHLLIVNCCLWNIWKRYDLEI